MSDLYFEDLQIGDVLTSEAYRISKDEMVSFARKWDPLPIHIDEDAARDSPHGGLIGSGEYSMAIKQLLITRLGFNTGVIGSIGYDELRYLRPVRPGDSLTLTVRCVDKHESRTKADRGVVRFNVALANQNGEVVLSYLDIVMMARRGTNRSDA